MSIKTAPIFSGQIYLRDISPDVAELEGDCDPNERAWVKVRQSTEQDNMEIANLTQSRTMLWRDDGVEQNAPVNQLEVRALEVYHTLTDAGNFFADDEGKVDLFQFVNTGPYQKIAGGFQEFKKRYGTLPASVTRALWKAVYSVNPDWDWLSDTRHNCPNCGHTFEPVRATRHKEGEAVSG